MQRDSGKPTPTRPSNRHNFTGRVGSQRREKRWSQASTRRPLVTYDQHGRPWYCETEIKSGMPCSPFQPQFLAPWYPQSNYIKVNPNNTAECFIDYDTMRADKRKALSGYHRNAVELATDKKWAIPEPGQAYERQIVAKLGTPPNPIQPIIAAQQENPWVIGWTEKPDPRLVEAVKSKRRRIELEDEGFDFGEDSYAETVSTVPARRDRVVQKSQDQQKLIEDVGEFQAEAVAGAEDDFVPNKPGANAQSLVDEDDPELAGAFDDSIEDDKKEEKLMDLEETVDPKSLGGTRVPVKTKPQVERAERRPPAPPTTARKPVAKKGGGGARRSIAQGARPVVADLHDTE